MSKDKKAKPAPPQEQGPSGKPVFRVTLRGHTGHWDIEAATAADAIESVRKQTGKMRHPSQFTATPKPPPEDNPSSTATADSEAAG